MNEITKATLSVVAGLLFSFLCYFISTHVSNDHPLISAIMLAVLALAAATCSWVGAYKMYTSTRRGGR